MAVTGDLTRYRYIETIGTGGMATVDLAEDTRLGREVALKRFTGAADDGLSRLRREALAGASISHPNLVSVFDAVTSDDGDLVIVMEYVRGETLRQTLNRRGVLPVGETLRIIDGVAAGLDAIHARGIVHRDVKPSNILLGEDGAVKVADLGIASIPDRTQITASGSVLGSLSYMAPEQLGEERSTPAIDVYALAAVAYEMLSGVKARREPNAVALAHAIATQPAPDLRDAWPQAPAAAAAVIAAAMSSEPRERPRSAGAFADRLRSAIDEPETVAMPPRRPPRVRPIIAPVPEPDRDEGRSTGRSDRVGAVLLALLVLAGIAAILIVLLSGGSNGSNPASHRTSHRTMARHRHHAPARRAASSTAASSTPARSTSTTSTAATQSSTPARSGSSASSSTSSAAGAGAAGGPPPTSGGGDPVSAVESFYGLAAQHHYPQAWAYADPAMRTQLEGYQMFRSGQSGDRSITFDSAKILQQSGNAATVAIRTTSVRNSGTSHCAGTVQLVRGSPGWQMDHIQINCS